MKQTNQPPVDSKSAKSGSARPKERGVDAMSRIKLALLEQYAQQQEGTGGDPYNTDKGPARDQWRGNARRI